MSHLIRMFAVLVLMGELVSADQQQNENCSDDAVRICNTLMCMQQHGVLVKECKITEHRDQILASLKRYVNENSDNNLFLLNVDIQQFFYKALNNAVSLEHIIEDNAELFDRLQPIGKWFATMDTDDVEHLYLLDVHEHGDVVSTIHDHNLQLKPILARYISGEKKVAKQRDKQNLVARVSADTGIADDIVTTLQIVHGYFNSLKLQERKEIQLVMKARGLYSSNIDGAWGPNTQIAFALYLAPAAQTSTANNLDDLFKEIKKGFVIENLWTRENYESELQQIWRTDRQNVITNSSPIRRQKITKPSSSNGASDEPFVKNMYVNGELQTCIKVGLTWDCN